MSLEPRRPNMFSTRLPLAALLASSLALTACTKDETDDSADTEVTDDTADTEVADQGQVRVIHMSPDAPNAVSYTHLTLPTNREV